MTTTETAANTSAAERAARPYDEAGRRPSGRKPLRCCAPSVR